MRWPWLSRYAHELEMDVLRATTVGLVNENDALKGQVEYWRTRAERLTDAALSRAGAIHEPTMVDRPAPSRDQESPMALLSRAMSVREIDSTAVRRPVVVK
jgi:hypothetical protein